MRHGPVILLPADGIFIPGDLVDLDTFLSWSRSDGFPEKGRIDWVAGALEVDMSPEDLNTHGSPKAAIARRLGLLIEECDLGMVYVDSTRLSAPGAELSTEPDVVVVLFESVRTGRVRLVPKSGAPEGRYVEIEGAADLVVECISDSSEEKDLKRLPARYFEAGVREYWTVDARRGEPGLVVHRRSQGAYVEVPQDPDGFSTSDILVARVRLVRLPAHLKLVRYRLDTQP